MTNPNDYSPPKTREPLPPHVAMTPAQVRAWWYDHAPQWEPWRAAARRGRRK